MKVQTEEKLVRITTFIAEDGETFQSEEKCLDYEMIQIWRSRLSEIPSNSAAEGHAPCNGCENMEYHNWYWFKPKTQEHIDILNGAYPEVDVDESDIGRWICVEVGECRGDYWHSHLEDSIDYAKELIEKFGYKVHIESPDEGGRNESKL